MNLFLRTAVLYYTHRLRTDNIRVPLKRVHYIVAETEKRGKKEGKKMRTGIQKGILESYTIHVFY